MHKLSCRPTFKRLLKLCNQQKWIKKMGYMHNEFFFTKMTQLEIIMLS